MPSSCGSMRSSTIASYGCACAIQSASSPEAATSGLLFRYSRTEKSAVSGVNLRPSASTIVGQNNSYHNSYFNAEKLFKL